MTDQELKDLVASLAINSAETSKQIKELRASQAKMSAESREETRELRASQVETRVQMEETFKQIRASQAKTDEQLDKLAQRIKDLSEMYGGVSDHLGVEAELNFTQALKDNPILNQVKFDEVKSNINQKADNKQIEVDILMTNGDSIAVVEVKRHLNSKHIEHLHDKTIPNFLELFPQYKDKKLYVALATYDIPLKARSFVNNRIKQYGYALITPDRTGYNIEVDTTHMRVVK